MVWLYVLAQVVLGEGWGALRHQERLELARILADTLQGPVIGDSFLVASGFLSASLAQNELGKRYQLSRLEVVGDSVAQRLVPRHVLRAWEARPLTPSILGEVLQEVLRLMGEAGYFMARASWDSLIWQVPGEAIGFLRIESGRQVQLDTVIIKGRWPASRRLFYQITGLWPRRPLSRTAWEKLPQRLAQSPYASLTDTPRLWLFEHLAWVEVALRPRQSSRLEGSLALAANPLSPNRTQVVGDLKADLVSPLRLGELLQLSYYQLIGGSQRLNLSLRLPHVGGGSFGIGGRFQLLRQDTSFLTRGWEVEGAYQLTPRHRLLGGLRGASSRLLSTAPYRQRIWPPPPNLDYRRQGVFLGWRYDSRDFWASPTRGWFVELIGTQGRRGYLPNPGLPLLDYQRLPARASYQELSLSIERYLPLGRLLTLRLWGQGYRFWAASYAENELYRAGGPADLRGFPENALPLSFFAQGGPELRLRLAQEDFLAFYAEGGPLTLYPNRQRLMQAIGLALQTRLTLGLFRISFTLARLLPDPFEPRKTLVALEWRTNL